MPPAATQSNNELWGDDDDGDDIILLASQAYDMKQAHDNLDITSFEGFQPNKKSNSTSTQKPVIISDDEDFLNDILIENDLHEKRLSQMPNSVKPAASENMFAMDTKPTAGPSRRRPNNPPPQAISSVSGINREQRNENIQKHISSAQDVKIKFLLKESEESKRQKNRFEEEIQQLTEKCQTKDGEVCFLIVVVVHLI